MFVEVGGLVKSSFLRGGDLSVGVIRPLPKGLYYIWEMPLSTIYAMASRTVNRSPLFATCSVLVNDHFAL